MNDYLQKLQVLMDLKKYEEVIRFGKKALEEDPTSGKVMHYLSLANYYLGNQDDALGLAEAAIQAGAVSPNLLCLMGEIYFARKEFRKAKEMAQTALELEPEKAAIFNLFTKICLETGDFKKAEVYVDQSLNLDPHNFFALNIKSLLLNNRGDEEGSRHYEELAMKENPNHTYGFQIKGTKAMIQGKWTEAAKNYQEARRLNPNNTIAQKQLRRMKIFNPELIRVSISLLILVGVILSISRIIYTEAREYHWLFICFNLLLGGRSFFPNLRLTIRNIRLKNWVFTSWSHTFLKVSRYISVSASLVLLVWVAYHSFVVYDYWVILWGSMVFFWLSLMDLLIFGLVQGSLSREGIYLLGVYTVVLIVFFQTPDVFVWIVLKSLIGLLLLSVQLATPALLAKKGKA